MSTIRGSESFPYRLSLGAPRPDSRSVHSTSSGIVVAGVQHEPVHAVRGAVAVQHGEWAVGEARVSGRLRRLPRRRAPRCHRASSWTGGPLRYGGSLHRYGGRRLGRGRAREHLQHHWLRRGRSRRDSRRAGGGCRWRGTWRPPTLQQPLVRLQARRLRLRAAVLVVLQRPPRRLQRGREAGLGDAGRFTQPGTLRPGRAVSRPALRTVSTSSTPPACGTTARSPPSVRTRGYDSIRFFTLESLFSGSQQDPRQVPSLQVRSTLRVTDHAPDTPAVCRNVMLVVIPAELLAGCLVPGDGTDPVRLRTRDGTPLQKRTPSSSRSAGLSRPVMRRSLEAGARHN